ncbi:HAMP domain-containing histidine kinase [Candidatus Saccharibacteria bacterium]|nr:HAMP domain-containing histidine kinase [Candidatus Saccharibacteria bacterium]
MDIRILLLFILVAVLVVIIVSLFSVSRKNTNAKWLAISTVLPLLWALFTALFLMTENQLLAHIFVVSYYVCLVLLPLPHILESIELSGRKVTPLIGIGILLVAATVCAMVVTPGVMIRSVVAITHQIELASIPYLIFCAYFFILYMAALVITFRVFLSICRANGQEKTDMGLLVATYVIAGVAGTVFNLILPFFGNNDLIWVGPIGLASVIPVAFRMATTGEYLSAVKTFFRGLVYCTGFVLIVAGGFVVMTLMNMAISPYLEMTWERYAVGGTAVVVSLLWILLVKRVSKKLVKKIDSDGYSEAQVISSIAEITVKNYGVKDFFSAIRHTLDRAFGVERVDIVIFNRDTSKYYTDDGGFEDLLMRVVSRKKRSTIYYEEIPDKKDQEAMKAHSIETITPIMGTINSTKGKGSNRIIGVILCSPRKRRFSRYYGETLEKVSAQLSPFIQAAVFYEQISGFNTKLKFEIKEKTKELRATNKELKKLDGLKDDLLTIASHQLRTPLTGVIGYADMMLDGDFGKLTAKQEEKLHEVLKSAKNMNKMLMDYLDAARMDSGRFHLQKQAFSLTDIVDEEVEQLVEVAKGYKRKLIYKRDKDDIEMVGDMVRIRQVVLNLIDNAIYYGKEKILVELRVINKEIYFVVKDDGIGVPKEEQGKLFTKMFRGSNAKVVRPDGSGIGLYVIKTIVKESGGEIIFKSSENKGSVFGFKFPIMEIKGK